MRKVSEAEKISHRLWLKTHPENRKKYYRTRKASGVHQRCHMAFLQRGLDHIQKAKDKPCADCGDVFHYAAMQFDHRPGTIKLFAIGTKGKNYSIEKLDAEIAKCDVVCANCHALRTWTRRQEVRN
jgi:hypothetical protein